MINDKFDPVSTYNIYISVICIPIAPIHKYIVYYR